MSSVNEYKCLSCKAPLRFDPPSQKFKCDYCFSEFTKEQLDEVYTDEGVEKEKLERKEKKEKEADKQLEKVLVLLGILTNPNLKSKIQSKIKDYQSNDQEEEKPKEVDLNEKSVNEKEEKENQVLAFVAGAMAGKKSIGLTIGDEEKSTESLTATYSDYSKIKEKIENMSLIIAEYEQGNYKLSSDYFSPMGIIYLLQQGPLKNIRFLNTKESLSGEEEDDSPNEKELDVYRCTSCGAELIADETTSATFCLYCKNPAIIKDRFQGKFKPKWVIPFRLTKDNAVDLYNGWIRKKRFAPKEFKNKEEIEKITGIYAPFWLFDCNAVGSISGKATKVSSYRSGDYEYTKTKYYNVARAGSSMYEKIPVDSSEKLDDELMYMIEPYNYEDITDFSMQYMTGFMAEKYDVEMGKAKKVMTGRAESFLEGRLRDTISGYSSYNTTSRDVDLLGVKNNYALMPIYLLVTKYKEKEHKFIVNGQTGKVVGETPISFAEQLKFGVILFSILTVVAIIGGALIG